MDVSTTTGIVWWKTDDRTDLDYTPAPLITRDNAERDLQFTQEIRLASSKDAPVALSDDVTLKWQTGVFVFTQDYEQDAVNGFSPFVLSPVLNFPVAQHSPESTLEDRGIGVYGRGTFTIRDKLEGTIGLRGDYERKSATIETFFDSVIAPGTSVKGEDSFSDVSPHVTLAYHVAPAKQMVYATAARGFKAGGFNAASPFGSEAYGAEHSWNYEAGVKTLWFADRLSVNGALFYLKWDDLQVNVQNPLVPLQFFIANAAGATSKGADVEVNVRLLPGCDFFGGLGYTNARFRAAACQTASTSAATGWRTRRTTPRISGASIRWRSQRRRVCSRARRSSSAAAMCTTTRIPGGRTRTRSRTSAAASAASFCLWKRGFATPLTRVMCPLRLHIRASRLQASSARSAHRAPSGFAQG